jgi:hypothetical protein
VVGRWINWAEQNPLKVAFWLAAASLAALLLLAL